MDTIASFNPMHYFNIYYPIDCQTCFAIMTLLTLEWIQAYLHARYES